MPGLDWDLNLNPDQQVLARRLSFSDADSAEMARGTQPRLPALPSITEDAAEGQEEETPVHPSRRAAPPSVPATSSATLHSAQGGTPHPTSAPVSTSMVLVAPPAPLQLQQLPGAVASEYERQVQAALMQQASEEAAREQGWALVPQLRLCTVAGRCAGYETKWDELHPASQNLLLRIEEKLGMYKYQSQQLDQCGCLDDPSLYNKSFELNASQIMQEVASISTIKDKEKVSIKGLTDVVKEMMWNIDTALHSYVKLRPRFVQQGAGGAAGYANRPGSFGAYTEFNQRLTKKANFYCYNGAPRCPSPFIQLTVARFEQQIGECFKLAEELEQLVQMKNDKSFPESLESLSKVMSNTHDYFIHVASKLENIHQAIEAMKTQYLNARRCRGDWNDPFVEADRRESAKKEATARMVHPTLHLSPPRQPKTPVIASVMAIQLQQNSFPTRGISPSSCPSPTLLPPLFLPTSSAQSSPAPITNPFSSSSITSSITSCLPTPHGGGTTVPASTGLRTNKGGRPPRSRR